MFQKMCAVFALALSCAVGMAAENLFPPFQIVKDSEAGGWYQNRAKVEAQFVMEAEAKVLKIASQGASGYADWRIFQHLEPGVYTVVLRVTGEGVDFNINAYSFQSGAKPQFILNEHIQGSANDRLLVKSFTVPAGSEKVRLGFTSSCTGNWTITAPALYAGKHTAQSLGLSTAK